MNLDPEDMEEFNKAQTDAQKMMKDVPGLGNLLGAQSAQQTKRRK
jgi:hypothetical protein